jgi:hypothetical protein
MTDDPYAEFAAPEAADPYAGLAVPAGPLRKSQGLGFLTGSMPALRNMAKVPSPFDLVRKPLMNIADKAIQAHVDKQTADGVEPGMWGQLAGALAGAAPAFAVPGGGLTQGAAFGALGSTADSPLGLAADVGLGAAGGKIGEALVGMAAKGIQQATRPAIQTLKAAGVKPTPGQVFGGNAAIREDKLMSRPVVGPKIFADRAGGLDQWNRGMVDDAISSLGVKLPADVKTGHDAVAFAQQARAKAYDDVIPKLTVDVDDILFNGMREVAEEARMLPDAAKQIVASAVKGTGFGNGTLSGKALQNARSELGRLTSSYSTSANAYEREAGRVLGWVRDHVDDALLRQNPKEAPALKAANAAHAKLLVIEDAASRADDGIFSTGQAKQAARRFDSSRRKTATARGEGPMSDLINAAREVLPSKYPDPGTAGRLMEGKLIPMIAGAGARVGYGVRGAAADVASRLPPEAAAFVRRFQKPVGLFGGMAPSAASAQQRK